MSDLYTLTRSDIAAALDAGLSSVGNWLAGEPLPSAHVDRQRYHRLIDVIPPLRRNRKRGLAGDDLRHLIDADRRERERRGLTGPNVGVDYDAADRFLACLTPAEALRADALRKKFSGPLAMALWTGANSTLMTRFMGLPASVQAILLNDDSELPPPGRETAFMASFAARNAPHLFMQKECA